MSKPIVVSVAVLVTSSIVLLTGGCGTVDESTQSEELWTQPAKVAASARFEYLTDSLMSENRRLKQQLDLVTAENRTLAARTSELETRLIEKPKTPPPPANLNAAYDAALAQYKQRNFSAAAEQFETLLGSSKGFELADNCHYWTGECYYGMKKYKDAMDHFEAVFNYVHATKKADAQLMIGNCQLALGNKAGAMAAFNRVLNNYPTSDLVAKAQEKLMKIR